MGYSVYDYSKMMGDSVRMDAYSAALKSVVNPNSVVLDIGAGTGIFSMLACRLGAKYVYAIEPNEAIDMAVELAKLNGYEHRIECIKGLSTKVTIPQEVDVIISDLRGALPLFELHIPSIVDARKRFLKSDGVLLPYEDKLWVALVEAPSLYERWIRPWKRYNFDLNLDPIAERFSNTFRNQQVNRDQLLSDPKLWCTLNYPTIENPNVSGDVDFRISRNGVVHGFVLWFDAKITESIGFSGGPGAPKEMVYGSAFFPWTDPVSVNEGDHVSIQLKANLLHDQYVWRWSSKLYRGGEGGTLEKHFNQSTFSGSFLSKSQLLKQSKNYVPSLNEDGLIHKFILDNLSNQYSMDEISRRVSERFSDRFKSSTDAFPYVSRIVGACSN